MEILFVEDVFLYFYLSYIMTSASFYRQADKATTNGGIYFEIPEAQLGKELQRRKNQEVSKGVQLDKLIH